MKRSFYRPKGPIEISGEKFDSNDLFLGVHHKEGFIFGKYKTEQDPFKTTFLNYLEYPLTLKEITKESLTKEDYLKSSKLSDLGSGIVNHYFSGNEVNLDDFNRVEEYECYAKSYQKKLDVWILAWRTDKLRDSKYISISAKDDITPSGRIPEFIREYNFSNFAHLNIASIHTLIESVKNHNEKQRKRES